MTNADMPPEQASPTGPENEPVLFPLLGILFFGFLCWMMLSSVFQPFEGCPLHRREYTCLRPEDAPLLHYAGKILFFCIGTGAGVMALVAAQETGRRVWRQWRAEWRRESGE